MKYGQERKGKFWTISEINYIFERPNIPAARIAEALGRTRDGVRHKRRGHYKLKRKTRDERLDYLENSPMVHFKGKFKDSDRTYDVEFIIMEFDL